MTPAGPDHGAGWIFEDSPSGLRRHLRVNGCKQDPTA